MSRPREFKQVDVFASAPFLGNPLAAVVDGTDLPAELMQRFARWTNLSETVFLLPPSSPDADYAVRIFTPFQELPFAGHPTLGAARAWLDSGGTPRAPGRIVQECGAGLVPIVCDGADLAFQAPATRRSGPIEEDRLAELAAALGWTPDGSSTTSGWTTGPDGPPSRSPAPKRSSHWNPTSPGFRKRWSASSARAAGGAPARRPTRSAPSPRGPAWPRTR